MVAFTQFGSGHCDGVSISSDSDTQVSTNAAVEKMTKLTRTIAL